MLSHLFFRHALLSAGWAQNVRITINNGAISGVTQDAVPEDGDEIHEIGLPGMPNLHSHSFQRAIAGLTESRGPTADSFWSWRDLMYRFALTMSPDDVQAVATLAFTEMLEAGFTSVAEFHYLHHAPDGTKYDDIAEMAARIGAAAAETGIDLLLLPVFYAHAGFGGLAPATAQRRFINNLDDFARLYQRCQDISAAGIAPHSLRAVTPEELTALANLAGRAPIHIHIAEQTKEVSDCMAWSGTSPVAWLLGHENVSSNWCLIHATHVSPAESAGMAKANAVVGLCPVTEANLGDGIFPARHYSGAYGIGSDSNVLISVAEELRQLEYSQRLAIRQRNVMADDHTRNTATALYQKSVTGGAQALGAAIAGLQIGAPANIVTLATGRLGPAAANPDTALSTAVFASRWESVDCVWVRGRKCVVDGRHAEAGKARRRFNQTLTKLL